MNRGRVMLQGARLVIALTAGAVLAGCGVTPPLGLSPATPDATASATPRASTRPAASPLVVPPDPTPPSTPQPDPATTPTASSAPTPSGTPTLTPQPSHQVNCRKVKCVALTFDDGPGPFTTTLLGHLKRANVPATFFMLGQRVKAYPKVTRAVAKAGHEIGVHTWDHRMLTKLNAQQVRGEITSSIKIVKRVTGRTPKLLRPPYGETNRAVATEARRAKVSQILWNVDTLDWKTLSTKKTVAAAVKQTRRGSILLLHDIHATSVAAVPGIVKALRKKGYTFVTVSQLLGKTKPGRIYSHG